MDTIRAYITKHRPWLVGVAFLLVAHIYQERPFDKAEAQATAKKKPAKEMIVGKWQSQGFTKYICMGDPRSIGFEKHPQFYEIRADGTYLAVQSKGTLGHEGNWTLSEGDSQLAYADCIDSAARQGQKLAERVSVTFNPTKKYPGDWPFQTTTVTFVDLSNNRIVMEAKGTFASRREFSRVTKTPRLRDRDY